ncbi:MAG TPA: YtfJ family protein, partial [Labilithrix sp.]|nr:YtfJ family protein [Labilithrix sp.]
LYEDQASSKVNAAFKAELARLARGDRYRDTVALVPVADVQGYDFWPARGFVRDAIRSESKKAGTTIYCDWDGAFQRAAGFRRGTSSVMLIGRDGRVRFSAEGQLSKEDRERVIALLRSEVELPSGS